MVHALEILHGLLKKDGILIDIHPSGEQPILEVVIGEYRQLMGYLHESDNFIEYAQANQAIESAIQQGLFHRQRQITFIFETVAASLADFQEYLDSKYTDAILTPGTRELIQAAMAQDPTRSLVMSEKVLITRLSRVN